MFEVDERYLSDVEDRIADVLDESRSFCSLVELCEGAYPQTVRTVLERMIDRGTVHRDQGRAVLRSALANSEVAAHTEPVVERLPRREPELPEPHPADYDWRFTLETRLHLSEMIAARMRPGGRVALLGAPTLLVHFVAKGLDALLFDRNEHILSALEAADLGEHLIRWDLFAELPLNDVGKFQAVVVDPPWYVPFFEAFMWRAAECAESGADVLVSFPPRLTRPNIGNDREHVMRLAEEAGLEFMGQTNGFFRYETPGFERTALAAAGIGCFDWRRGNLLRFSRTAAAIEVRRTPPPPGEPQWLEYRLGNLRVKLRLPLEDLPGFRAIEVKLADLDGVSRRAPARGKINVWTSTNRAYQVEGLGALDAALRAIEVGSSVDRDAAVSSAAFDIVGDDAEMLKTFVDLLINE